MNVSRTEQDFYTLKDMEPNLAFLGNSMVLKCRFDQFEANTHLTFSTK